MEDYARAENFEVLVKECRERILEPVQKSKIMHRCSTSSNNSVQLSNESRKIEKLGVSQPNSSTQDEL